MDRGSRRSVAPARTAIGVANYYHVTPEAITVAVEGDDDGPFWAAIFLLDYKGRPVKIRPVAQIHGTESGGLQELLKVLARVRSGDAKATLVAMDSEYDDILHDKPRHRGVVKTGRHSIENYLYDPLVIDRVLALCCRQDCRDVQLAALWAAEIENAFRELLHLDCTCARMKLPHRVMGFQGAQFLEDNHYRPSCAKIARCRAEVPIERKETRKTRGLFGDLRLYHYIRGHFLTECWRKWLIHKVCALTGRRNYRIRPQELFHDCLHELQQIGGLTQLPQYRV